MTFKKDGDLLCLILASYYFLGLVQKNTNSTNRLLQIKIKVTFMTKANKIEGLKDLIESVLSSPEMMTKQKETHFQSLMGIC